MSLDSLASRFGEAFEARLKKRLLRVDERACPGFNDALAYTLLAGGKRLRPMLLLFLAAREENFASQDLALDAAVAVEFIHAYSLIHDDLPAMDNASLRRGQPTLHLAFDETRAILVGDALNTEAFGLLARLKTGAKTKIRLISTLAAAAGAGGMVLGQAMDCAFAGEERGEGLGRGRGEGRGEGQLDEEGLEFLQHKKTGELIAASLQMGAILGGHDEESLVLLREFGLGFGLCFQIIDDLLDARASQEQTGKDEGQDEGRASFYSLLGFEGCLNKIQNEKEKIYKTITSLENINPQRKIKKILYFLLDKYLDKALKKVQ